MTTDIITRAKALLKHPRYIGTKSAPGGLLRACMERYEASGNDADLAALTERVERYEAENARIEQAAKAEAERIARKGQSRQRRVERLRQKAARNRRINAQVPHMQAVMAEFDNDPEVLARRAAADAKWQARLTVLRGNGHV